MTEIDHRPECCPKCHWEVGDAVECPRCGVIVAKALEVVRAEQTVEVVTTGSGGGGRLTTLLLLIALGGVAIFAIGNATDEEVEPERVAAVEPTGAAERLPPAPRVGTRPRVGTQPSAGGENEPSYEDGVYDDPVETARAEPAGVEQRFETYDYAWLEGASGFRQGIEQAAREGRPVVMYFYTDWCGYCRQLDDNLLEHATVEDYTKYLVKIRINPEKGQVERALAREYGVRGYPSLFVLADLDSKPVKISSNKGRRLKRPAEFVDTLRRAARG